MKKNGIVFLGSWLLLFLLGLPLHAAENISESDLAYRKATLKALVAESQREKSYPRRQLPDDLPQSHNSGNPVPMELEPEGFSSGDVVSA